MDEIDNLPVLLFGLFAATLLFVCALYYFTRSRRFAKREHVLILGLSDAGKTKLFTKLVDGGSYSSLL